MFYHRIKISVILSLILVTAFTTYSWGDSCTVDKDDACACNTDTTKCSIQKAIVDNCNPIYVKPASKSTCPYYNPITITSAVNIIGLKANGDPAWTAGTAGSSTDAPTIKYDGVNKPVIKILADNVEIMGLNVAVYAPTAITATAITSNKITLTYNTFKIGETPSATDHNKSIAIGVDYGNTVNYLTVNYCAFTGQTTKTSNWFYVGNTGNGGKISNLSLTNNVITNAMAIFDLKRAITNVVISNNSFNNTWDASRFGVIPYLSPGYLLFDDTGASATNIINGITLTHNVFNNSTVATAPEEFSVLFTKKIIPAAAGGGDWKTNVALHSNSFLQTDDSGSNPIVGFEFGTSVIDSITGTTNWWGTGSAANKGPNLFSGSNDSTRADVSGYVSYKPWSRSDIFYTGTKVTAGSYVAVPANSYNMEITGTQMLNANMSMQVKTNAGGAATFIPTRYNSAPTTTAALPSGSAIGYFDLGIKKGGENIGAITATFYAPSTMASPYLYFYNGSGWVACSTSNTVRKITATSSLTVKSSDVSSTWFPHIYSGGAVTYVITATKSHIGHITPTLYEITRTSIHTPTRTFFALVGTPATTTILSSNTTTTTSTSSGSGTSTTTSASSTTTTATATTTSTPKTTTTSTPKTTTTSIAKTTTTTATNPKLTVSPSTLSFADNETARQITISNTGSGSLTWEIQDNATVYAGDVSSWVFSANPKSGLIKTTPEDVTVTVSRKGINIGTHTATLPIVSNGGNRELAVSMDVAQKEAPLLAVSTQLVLFLGKEETTKTFKIFNLGTGSLTWEAETPTIHKGEGWLTVSPPTGYALKQSEVTVTVKKDNLGPGLYSATIPLRSNAGTKNIIVSMLVYDGPVLSVNPSVLIFLSKTETEKKFTIANSKTGTLTFEMGAPEYSSAGTGWITSVSPSSGSIETEQAEVTLKVSRDTLNNGLYRATIPITSNGGNIKVVTYLFVIPFF